jgi:hypothetical protein
VWVALASSSVLLLMDAVSCVPGLSLLISMFNFSSLFCASSLEWILGRSSPFKALCRKLPKRRNVVGPVQSMTFSDKVKTVSHLVKNSLMPNVPTQLAIGSVIVPKVQQGRMKNRFAARGSSP